MKKTFALLALIVLLGACAPAPVENSAPVKVYYAGGPSGVKAALDLAVQSGTVTLVDQLADAQTLVLNGIVPEGAAKYVAEGAGLLLILGEDVTEAQASRMLGTPVSFQRADEAVSLTDTPGTRDPLLTEIIWNGAPQVRERSVLDDPDPTWTTWVSAFGKDEGFLYQLPGGKFVITSWLSGEANPQIQEWGYFNYLI